MALSLANGDYFLNCELRAGVRSGQNVDPTYFHDASNFTSAEITSAAQEYIKRLSNKTSSYGSALGSIPKATDAAKLKLEFDDMPPALLAVMLGADVTEIIQSTGAITDEAITPVLGAWIPLANSYIAAHGTGTEIAVKTSGDVAIASSHYLVDLNRGLYKALDATGATAAKISYHKAAKTVARYDAGQAKSAYVQLSGTATNRATNEAGNLDIWCASLSASGTFQLLAGDYIKGVLEGDLIVPTGKVSPWRWDVAA